MSDEHDDQYESLADRMWIQHFLEATPSDRLKIARGVRMTSQEAATCILNDHATKIAQLTRSLEDSRALLRRYSGLYDREIPR